MKSLRKKAKKIVALGLIPFSPYSFLKGCGGEDGTGQLIVGIQGDTQETAIVSYLDIDCSSPEGKTIVGRVYELCPNAVSLEDVDNCAGVDVGFSEIETCTDVTLSPGAIETNVQVLNDCRGVVKGTLDDQTGSCLLISSGNRCECQVDTAALSEAHNEDFATRISEGVATLRGLSESAKSKVFDGIENPSEAEFQEETQGDDTVYRFDCSLF